jgi:hypothetical protein
MDLYSTNIYAFIHTHFILMVVFAGGKRYYGSCVIGHAIFPNRKGVRKYIGRCFTFGHCL